MIWAILILGNLAYDRPTLTPPPPQLVLVYWDCTISEPFWWAGAESEPARFVCHTVCREGDEHNSLPSIEMVDPWGNPVVLWPSGRIIRKIPLKELLERACRRAKVFRGPEPWPWERP